MRRREEQEQRGRHCNVPTRPRRGDSGDECLYGFTVSKHSIACVCAAWPGHDRQTSRVEHVPWAAVSQNPGVWAVNQLCEKTASKYTWNKKMHRRHTRGEGHTEGGEVEDGDVVYSAVMAMKQAVSVAIQHGDIRQDAVRAAESESRWPLTAWSRSMVARVGHDTYRFPRRFALALACLPRNSSIGCSRGALRPPHHGSSVR